MFMLGRDYYGKKQPAFTYVRAAKRSAEPITCTWPSGSIRNAMLGLAIWWLRQVGAASMMPPTLQKDAIYSLQLLNREGVAMTVFFGRNFASIGLISSTRSELGSSYFFLSCWRDLIWSTLIKAWPRPLNSSSILKIHVDTYKFFAISWAKECMNSCSS